MQYIYHLKRKIPQKMMGLPHLNGVDAPEPETMMSLKSPMVQAFVHTVKRLVYNSNEFHVSLSSRQNQNSIHEPQLGKNKNEFH